MRFSFGVFLYSKKIYSSYKWRKGKNDEFEKKNIKIMCDWETNLVGFLYEQMDLLIAYHLNGFQRKSLLRLQSLQL